ncbi:lysylphosphatidylglycerol synthase transmembrane domain-containing protein [Alteromonas sp. a30]|uniref:lysylphosphatidylglycerol synthase transmembrane domain-containing protein n=1 Tax=Alteromonas sp. a30 TaxID=2730917 RepID=UPI0022813190|nr:lysylphosphatidylglycerol synthase transmembrane domain-containing protein [Alteromonas sp. a30]MCY7295030.1 flippase-like domain-containing protein [Alteromonas sp. a30]
MSEYQLSGWKFKALIISIVLSALGYLGFSVWGGWEEVQASFVEIGFIGAAIALSMSLINYGLRFIRWQMYLQVLGHKLPVKDNILIYISGFALTTTPGKAGEAFRGVLLKPYNVSYFSSFAAFISERLSDLLAIVALALIGLSQYPEGQVFVMTGGLIILSLLLLMGDARILNWIKKKAESYTGKIAKLVGHIATVFLNARRCHEPKLMASALILSLISWGAEALAFYWVLEWLGADISLPFAVFIYAISMLAGALSFLPGGLGGAEAAMLALLVLKNVPMPTAIAATVFIRLATLWFAVGLGIWALYLKRKPEAMHP